MKKQMKKGDAEDDKLTPVKALVTNGKSASCGAEFTAVVTRDGEVFTYGLPQYGQLGHGTDHEYNTSASSIKIVYEPQPHPKRVVANGFGERKIVKLACGTNHVACFDDAGKIWTWGNGGYGRLGHRVQKDEFAPKMVEIQGGDRNLVPADAVLGAGSTSTFVSALQGQMYAFGKLKTTGDNTMYPVPLMDLQGWVLRDFACGSVTFAGCAEKSAVTWGGGAYGELGYGPKGKKSSANPDLVPSLEGKTTRRVACGNGYTLFLVDKEDAKDLPAFTPGPDQEPKPAVGAKTKAGAAKGGAAKKAKK
jgi:alpha-tubulin suppressor-like RCC1 family protein